MAIVVNPKFQLRKEFGEQKLCADQCPQNENEASSITKIYSSMKVLLDAAIHSERGRVIRSDI
jgi:predicted dinucleotide-utilizing enzyme